jgi:hypothetical protein
MLMMAQKQPHKVPIGGYTGPYSWLMLSIPLLVILHTRLHHNNGSSGVTYRLIEQVLGVTKPTSQKETGKRTSAPLTKPPKCTHKYTRAFG